MPASSTTNLQDFIRKAEADLQKIRGEILLSAGGELTADLTTNEALVEGMVKEAEDLNNAELLEALRFLHESLAEFTEGAVPSDDAYSRRLLDGISGIESVITSIRFGLGDFEQDVSSLLDESFDMLEMEPSRPAPSEGDLTADPTEGGTEEEFEIDAEMMEIFAMEAEDHLKNIGENLTVLEQMPDDRDSLLEIRRSAHTLKGSAGIVGLHKLSNLAHKVEDLLDHLSENEIDGNEEIFKLLLASTDCISAVANNESSAELESKISATFEEFDKVRSLLGEVSRDTSAPNTPETNGADSAMAQETAAEKKHATGTEQATRSVVRVSLERLDDLVRLVREMIFGRAVFQQRLSALELQIKELQNATRRLQRSSGKLETDFGPGLVGGSRMYGDPGIATRIPNGNEFGIDGPAITDAEFDSLEFDRYTDFHQITRELLETTSDTFAINSELNSVRSYLESFFDNQKRVLDEIQEKLLSLRMIAFGSLSARLQRTVRIASMETEKLADLVVEGEDLEVDTHILDVLVDPLLHLLRNAVAHGIEAPESRRLLGKHERGAIVLKAYSEGTHIIITVSDDGGGILATRLKEKAVLAGQLSEKEAGGLSDEEALGLVFLPGVTTADEVSQIAGRGVGMNVVKTNILRQQGTISVSSEIHKGTTFTIRLPMALAITRALLVRVNDRKFAFPLKLIKHIAEIENEELNEIRKTEVITIGDDEHPVLYLNDLLRSPQNPNLSERDVRLLLVDTVKRRCVLLVDEILGPEEIVIKPLGHPLQDVPDLLGGSILGDGAVVPVLDLAYLLDPRKPVVGHKRTSELQKAAEEKPVVMIVDDSPSVRHVNSRLVRSNNWEPVIAKDGAEALELLYSMPKLPDVVLTDVEMPEMDGYELLVTARQHERLRELPIVMITSRAGDKHRRKAFDLGASEYLAKPYEDARLIEIIENLTR